MVEPPQGFIQWGGGKLPPQKSQLLWVISIKNDNITKCKHAAFPPENFYTCRFPPNKFFLDETLPTPPPPIKVIPMLHGLIFQCIPL